MVEIINNEFVTDEKFFDFSTSVTKSVISDATFHLTFGGELIFDSCVFLNTNVIALYDRQPENVKFSNCIIENKSGEDLIFWIKGGNSVVFNLYEYQNPDCFIEDMLLKYEDFMNYKKKENIIWE